MTRASSLPLAVAAKARCAADLSAARHLAFGLAAALGKSHIKRAECPPVRSCTEIVQCDRAQPNLVPSTLGRAAGPGYRNASSQYPKRHRAERLQSRLLISSAWYRAKLSTPALREAPSRRAAGGRLRQRPWADDLGPRGHVARRRAVMLFCLPLKAQNTTPSFGQTRGRGWPFGQRGVCGASAGRRANAPPIANNVPHAPLNDASCSVERCEVGNDIVVVGTGYAPRKTQPIHDMGSSVGNELHVSVLGIAGSA